MATQATQAVTSNDTSKVEDAIDAKAAGNAVPAAAGAGAAAEADGGAVAAGAGAAAVGDSAATGGLKIEEVVAKDAARAAEAKVRGNNHFARKEYAPAIECYAEALALCPVDDTAAAAIFHANRAACYLALNEFDHCIADCTASLTLTPGYQRALLRRAKAYEALGRPYDALQDVNAVVAANPKDHESRALAARLQVESDKKFEQQKDEMLSKLKEMGNGLLGKFGLSLDNFKATKDPNTGSYSIAFQNAGQNGAAPNAAGR